MCPVPMSSHIPQFEGTGEMYFSVTNLVFFLRPASLLINGEENKLKNLISN